ncbi:class I SAM-dependent DNA methyltransferase [Chitinophaga varians]|uniref:class I SAM-dependent DNA methyltransferase n=1 Tax=Chitinophaga varians TaxID=2202339 RepID=UPI00165F4194|nr:class I SAM-dependent methyltransferase [Chitinophaga varians]MBC9909641.1 methyltransferase domain-containing protein [Chitinophaga varians]
MDDKTALVVQLFGKNARLYEEKFMDTQGYQNALDVFCQSIPREEAAILELACGPGNITHYLLHQRPDFRLLGTDLSPDMLDLARKNNPGAIFQLLDCADMTTLPDRYDGIMVGFLLPYLSQEATIKLVRDAVSMLQHGGVLYLSTMEDDYTKSGWRKSSTGDDYYQYFHTGAWLQEVLREHGFSVIHEQRIASANGDGTPVTDLILIASL